MYVKMKMKNIIVDILKLHKAMAETADYTWMKENYIMEAESE